MTVADWTYAFIVAGLRQGRTSLDYKSREHGSDPDRPVNARGNVLACAATARTRKSGRGLAAVGCAGALCIGDGTVAKLELAHLQFSIVQQVQGRAGLRIIPLSGEASPIRNHTETTSPFAWRY